MKKICILLAIFSIYSASFTCEFNQKTHKLIECEDYKNASEEIKEECKLAHSQYNKYVASKLARKAKQKATRLGNSLSKFIGEAIDDSEKPEE